MSSQFGFIDIILLAMFAGFIILRLRNILGRKTGHQSKPMGRYFPKGMEVLKDIENNEAIRTGNVDEHIKKEFLKGAEIAYETILTSFANGDSKKLKDLLTPDMATNFEQAIKARNKENIKSEFTFIGIKESNVEKYEKIKNELFASVKFVS